MWRKLLLCLLLILINTVHKTNSHTTEEEKEKEEEGFHVQSGMVTSCEPIHETCDETQEVVKLRDSVFSTWQEYSSYTTEEREMLKHAAYLACKYHRGQTRKNVAKSAYVTHAFRVARIVMKTGGVYLPNVVAAALLHDTREDTSITLEEITCNCNKRVATTVDELTDPNKASQNKHAPYKSLDARLIKLADRYDNLRDLLNEPPPSWSKDKIQSYCNASIGLLEANRHVNKELERDIKGFVHLCISSPSTISIGSTSVLFFLLILLVLSF